MIDLTGQSIIKHNWILDEETSTVTIQFLSDAEDVLGEVTIEQARARSFLEALNSVSLTVFPREDFAQFFNHRTTYIQSTGKAKTNFIGSI